MTIEMLHWYECPDCLAVVSSETAPPSVGRGFPCGVCGAVTDYQGRTDTDGARWKRVEERTACDERCTGARGRNCACQCFGKNHGTGRRVRVVVSEGLPRMEPPRDAAKLRANVEAFRAKRDEVRAIIDARFGDVFRRKAAGEWVSDFGRYLDGRGYLTDLRAACAKRSHKGRMDGIERVRAQLAAPVLA